MGEGNGVASVIMLTFTAPMLTTSVGPGCGWLAGLAKAVVGLFQGVDELCWQIYVKTTYICTTLCHS